VAGVTGMKAPNLFTTVYMHAAPQDAVLASKRRTGVTGGFWHHRTRAMQDPAIGFQGIHLLRTPVNKGTKEGQGR
jgi:hypothetical protein